MTRGGHQARGNSLFHPPLHILPFGEGAPDGVEFRPFITHDHHSDGAPLVSLEPGAIDAAQQSQCWQLDVPVLAGQDDVQHFPLTLRRGRRLARNATRKSGGARTAPRRHEAPIRWQSRLRQLSRVGALMTNERPRPYAISGRQPGIMSNTAP